MVQLAYRNIAEHIEAKYSSNQRAKFLSGADGWLVAHAMFLGGAVVTFEKVEGLKAKIPTVCGAFNVECIGLYEMLRRMGVKFTVST